MNKEANSSYYPDRTEGSGKFPHLQAYIDRGMGKRPSKKIKFVKEDTKNYATDVGT